MINKNKIVVVLLATMLLSGCATNNENINNINNKDIKSFGADALTLRIHQQENNYNNDENPYDTLLDGIGTATTTSRKDGMTPEEVQDFNDDGTRYKFNQLKLKGKDESKLYKRSGDNIVYNGVTYINLAKIMESIKVPCDERTFINFIVKTYTPTDNKVNIMFSEDYTRTSESLSQTLSDELKNLWGGYETLLAKYKVPVMWMIRLYDSGSDSVLYGNHKYLIYKGANGNLEINMSFYDEGGYIEDDTDNIAVTTTSKPEQPESIANVSETDNGHTSDTEEENENEE